MLAKFVIITYRAK